MEDPADVFGDQAKRSLPARALNKLSDWHGHLRWSMLRRLASGRIVRSAWLWLIAVPPAAKIVLMLQQRVTDPPFNAWVAPSSLVPTPNQPDRRGLNERTVRTGALSASARQRTR
jgi:hypothetical protein